MSKIRKSLLSVALAVPTLFTAVIAQSNDTKTPVPLKPHEISELTEAYGNTLYVLRNLYVDTLDLREIVKSGYASMLGKIDPYTEVYTQENIDELKSVSSGDYGGIGCAITKRDSVVVMSGPYFDSPSRKAGVRHGDILLELDGEPVKVDKTTDLSDISSRLRGEPGTAVKLKVRRPWMPSDSDSIFDITIIRDKIKIDPLPYFTVLDGGVAYFDVSTFNRNTASEIRREFTRMKSELGDSLKGVILDLRNNGGGITAGAVDLLSIFLPRGSHAYTARYRDGEGEPTRTQKSPVDAKIPLAVMIDDGTASSSEIVAGAIQDLDRGVITGSRSFGKGLIQSSVSISEKAVLKYTTGKYYLPSGRLIQALDYTSRDGRGRLTATDDTVAPVFSTRAGRPVTGSRGIEPDVKIESDTVSDFTYTIYLSGVFEDYANRYRNRSTRIPSLNDTLVTDSIMLDFKGFINQDKIKYDRRSENGISYLRSAARFEKLDNDSVMATLDLLERLMKHDFDRDFEAFSPEIRRTLESELGRRYFSDPELAGRVLPFDPAVEQTRLLLLDPKRYKAILSKKN